MIAVMKMIVKSRSFTQIRIPAIYIFIVYGYMHSGNYEGREGIMVNHFSHGDVMLEEMIFIPFG